MTSLKPKSPCRFDLLETFLRILYLARVPTRTSDIAAEMDLSLRSVQRYLKELTELGFLTRKRESNRHQAIYQTTPKIQVLLRKQGAINPEKHRNRFIDLCCVFFEDYRPSNQEFYGTVFDKCVSGTVENHIVPKLWEFSYFLFMQFQKDIDELKDGLERDSGECTSES